MKQQLNICAKIIKKESTLFDIEQRHRSFKDLEYILPAVNTSFMEIVNDIIPDRNGMWATPLYYYISKHNPILGEKNVSKTAFDYLQSVQQVCDFDILSISVGMRGDVLELKTLLRCYDKQPNMAKIFALLGDDLYAKQEDNKPTIGKIIEPEEVINETYSLEEKKAHYAKYREQTKILEQNSIDKPFLNQIDSYVPKELPKAADRIDMVYDLETKDRSVKTMLEYSKFSEIFKNIMTWVSGVEYYAYIKSIEEGRNEEENFMYYIEQYVINEYIETELLPKEDLPTLMDKLYRSLFQLYIVQDLIDDPNITDIKITAPDSIRVRYKGKAYLSNVCFIDTNDYLRFIDGIAHRNGISLNVPEQTFTDTRDGNYILRFSITSAYVNSVDWPYLHIRKVSRTKLLADDLIKAGMMDEKIRDYLLDCGKHSRGVVFAGPPGSGKTVALNWFLEEAYEQSAEILVIQENDELFAYRKGVMFQHVVNYASGDNEPVTLEQLGQLALVAGANVFIIGEAKGAEICSAITLSNSGCRTAITIHSQSSLDTIDKMADLAMRGFANDYMQAKRLLKSFQTIVYLEDFKVKEISEITGFNEKTGDMNYNYIYKRPENQF